MGVIEEALRLSWTVRRKPLEAFLLPVAAVSPPSGAGVLLGADGSFVSLFAVEGSRSMMGAEELERFVSLASRRLNGLFTAPGHALHVVFERAPEEAGLVVEAAGTRQRRQCERLGLELGDVIADRGRRLAPLMAAETMVLACWTRPSALPPDDAKRDVSALKRRLKAWLPGLRESQCPFAAQSRLAPRHEALLDTLAALFAECGLVAGALDTDEAVRVMRVLVNGPASTGPEWRPVTAANDAPVRVTEPVELGGFPPPLSTQLLVRTPKRRGAGLEMGERLYAPLDLALGPREARPFSELMRRLGEAGLPFRFSLLLEGGALSSWDASIARVAASFLAFSSNDSALVRNSLEELVGLSRDAQAVVRLRLGFLTWVGADEDVGALERRVSRLQQLAEGWGEMVFTPLVGDPVESLAGAVPGFCCGGTAAPAAAPLTEALKLWPVSRPAPLARRTSGVLFRAPDGKPLPFSYEEGEDYGFELIYGVPGRGKSVLMNSLSLAFALQSGQARLPFTAIIDIGPSSSGLISLLREALPREHRDEVGWFPLLMTPEYAINPCDTQLGCRQPLPAERAFLANLLSLVLTPAGADGVPDGMRELIGPVIAAVYAMRSDEIAGAEPHPYAVGRDALVDEALAVENCHLPQSALWWDVVDVLFDAGAVEAAERAQAYAVPTLVDLLAAVREPSVQGLVGAAVYGHGGETVTQAFIRIVTALSGSWPIMFSPTVFDIGHVRVAAIDLSAVAPRGSAEADRQTAAFYLLARHALTRHWWIGEDEVAGAPEKYRAWHRRRLRGIREAPKRLAFDEFHRTAGAPSARRQVERDVREARKLRVRLVLASQRIEDFGESLIELANRYWVLGAGGKTKEVETLSALFELNETLAEVVRYSLNGPGKDGAPALLLAADERGRFEQLVVNSLGPVELWALSTAPRDTALRERLYRRLTPGAARAALASAFPGGSAREAIDAELARLEGQGNREAASEDAVLEGLVERLVERAVGGNDGGRAVDAAAVG